MNSKSVDAAAGSAPLMNPSRRSVCGRGLIAAAGLIGVSGSPPSSAAAEMGCSEWIQPSNADFAAIFKKPIPEVLDRVLTVLEDEVVPKTMTGVRAGNKLFGAAILKKDDLTTVVAATNTETGNPLMHGEVTAIFAFYGQPKYGRPDPADCIFVSTHEPCPLCLSSITWAGFNNFLYLFTYEDSRDAYGIPHDIVMLDEIFRCPNGTYSEKNKFWSSWALRNLIAGTSTQAQAGFNKRVERLAHVYAEMSDIYQKAKLEGRGADVPLK